MSAPTYHDTPSREELERLYAQLLSVVPVLARALNKPNPILSREERLRARAPLAERGTLDTAQGRTASD